MALLCLVSSERSEGYPVVPKSAGIRFFCHLFESHVTRDLHFEQDVSELVITLLRAMETFSFLLPYEGEPRGSGPADSCCQRLPVQAACVFIGAAMGGADPHDGTH